MRVSFRFSLLGALAASGAPSSPVWAEQPKKPAPTAPAVTPAQPGEPGVLEGPKVAPPSGHKTLITRDFEGKIKRLEVPPEEAALDLVEFEPATREKLNKILAERAAMLDKIVSDNLLKIVEAYNANLSGDKNKARPIYAEILVQAQPLRDRGKLGDELQGVMSPEQAEAWDAIRREYWQSLLDEDMESGQTEVLDQDPKAGVAPPRGRLLGAVRREIANSVGAEFRRSFERQAAARAEELKGFIDALELAPEQETKVRNILIDDYQKTQGKRSVLQSLALFQAISAELTPEQRESLGKYIRERRAK